MKFEGPSMNNNNEQPKSPEKTPEELKEEEDKNRENGDEAESVKSIEEKEGAEKITEESEEGEKTRKEEKIEGIIGGSSLFKKIKDIVETPQEIEDVFGEETEEKRKEKWENELSEEEKKEEIEKTKEYVKDKLIKEAGIEEKDFEDMKKLQEYQEKIQKEVQESVEQRKNIFGAVEGQLKGNSDIINLEGLGLSDIEKFKDISSDMRKITQGALDMERLKYYLAEIENVSDIDSDIGSLLETHEIRKISMERLEYVLKQIKRFEDLVKELEEIQKEDAEAFEKYREEVEEMIEEVKRIAKEDESLFEKLKESGIVLGLIALASALGISGLSGLIKLVGGTASFVGKHKIESAIVAGGVTYAVAPGLVTGAVGFGAGALVGGGLLLKMLSWLYNEENRDKLAQGMFGVSDFPRWYYFLGGKRAKEKK